MLLLPIGLFLLPTPFSDNWAQEIPKLVMWYLIFGLAYIIFYL